MDPWLDSLSEDWIPQPRSSSSARNSDGASANSDLSAINTSQCRIPRYKPLGEHGQGNTSAISERTRPKHVKSTHDSSPSEHGRRLSRTVSCSTTQSVQRHTVQHHSLSSSPKKSGMLHDTPEWKRKWVDGVVMYGEQRDLFSGGGLESIFHPPPPQQDSKPFQIPRGNDPPSSPPAYSPSPSRGHQSPLYASSPASEKKQTLAKEVDESTEAGGVREHEDVESLGKDIGKEAILADSGEHEKTERDIKVAGESANNCGEGSGSKDDNENERPLTPAFRNDASPLSKTVESSGKQDTKNRTRIGKDEEKNEAFSLIYVSKHNTVDGRIGYAPFVPQENQDGSVSKESFLDYYEQERSAQSVHFPLTGDSLGGLSSLGNWTSPSLPGDLSTGTKEFAAKGGFINFKRGGYDSPSFRQRSLSPSSLPEDVRDQSAVRSSEGEDSHCSTKGTLRKKAREPRSTFLSPIPSEPKTPKRSPVRNGASPERSRPSGSPLKLFGNYDTFTNEKFKRRMSQLEDSLFPGRTPSEKDYPTATGDNKSRHAEPLDLSCSHRLNRNNQSKDRVAAEEMQCTSRLSSFGEGQFDEYVFNQEMPLGLPKSGDFDEDRENQPPLPELKHGSQESFRFEVKVPDLQNVERVRTRSSRTVNEISCKYESTTNGIKAERTQSPDTLSGRANGQRYAEETTNGRLEGKRPPASPSKNPTPKRRRTLHKSEIIETSPSRSMAAESIRETHSQMQSVIGRKRKDARYDNNGERADAETLARRQILLPRNTTPNQSQRRSSTVLENGIGPTPVDKELSAIPEDLQSSPLEHDLNAHAAEVAEELESLHSDEANHLLEENQRGSVTTQDFLNEALRIMDFIRARSRPEQRLASLNEADGEVDSSIAESVSACDSTKESFSRPPSREGIIVSKLRVPGPQDARIFSHLKKYQDHDDMDLIVTSSLKSLDITKKAAETPGLETSVPDEARDPPNIRVISNPDHIIEPIATSAEAKDDSTDNQPLEHGSHSSAPSWGRTVNTSSSSRRSETKQVIQPEMVSHLISGQIGKMVFDDTTQKWIKKRGAHEASTGASKGAISEPSEDDPFGSIPDLTVDELEETRRVQSTRSVNPTTMNPLKDVEAPDLGFATKRVHHRDSLQGDVASSRPQTRDGTENTVDSSSAPSKYSRFASSYPRTETRATSWGDEVFRPRGPVEDQANNASGSTCEDQPLEAQQEKRKDDEHTGLEIGRIDHEYTRADNTSSSPISSQLQNPDHMKTPSGNPPFWTDASQITADDFEEDPIRDLHRSSPGQQSASRVASFRFTPQSGYRGAARRVSFGGRSFTARPISRIDERSEKSFHEFGDDYRRASFDVTLSTPLPIRDLSASIAMPPTTGRRANVSFHLSPLSEFNLDQIDDSLQLEVSYIAKRQGHLSTKEAEASFSLAIEELVKKLTDVEPFEPYWEYIRQLDLKNKGLMTLHMLNQFCGRIEDLDVSSNEIGQLGGVPSSLRSLRAQGNCLSNLTAWSHLPNLQYLDVSDNSLDSLEGLQCLFHLRGLKADGNNITSLKGVLQFNGLISLSLTNNALGSVDFKGSDLKRLTTVDLRGSGIREVKNLHCLPALERLDLGDNKIRQLHVGGDGLLRNLQALRLPDNDLKNFDITPFPNIRLLDLDRNGVRNITGLTNAKYLDTLSWREQKLSITQSSPSTTTNMNIDECHEVRSLYVSGNHLTLSTLSPKLDFLNLQHLEVASASLQALPADFGHKFPNLRVLNLNFNALKDIGPLRGIKRLECLMLAGNRLTRLRKTMAVLKDLSGPGDSECGEWLQKVDLRSNPITIGFYPQHAFAGTTTSPTATTTEHSRILTRSRQNPQIFDYKYTDAFALASLEPSADIIYRRRIDDDTALRRKVYEMLLRTACPSLTHLDGLAFPTDRSDPRSAVDAVDAGNARVDHDDDDALFGQLVGLGVLRRRSGSGSGSGSDDTSNGEAKGNIKLDGDDVRSRGIGGAIPTTAPLRGRQRERRPGKH
ncbi:MAG: hypothetical protein M1819_001497 [Sarea resinae]|nr:MAG: hypothetical protein M1819_001497 [Sarea resinae]